VSSSAGRWRSSCARIIFKKLAWRQIEAMRLDVPVFMERDEAEKIAR